MQKPTRLEERARAAAAPQQALYDGATFATVLSKRTERDQRFHDGDDSESIKRAAWWRAKILTSSFLVHCRKGAPGGWSQDKLAKALGVTRGYIAQVESLNSTTKAPLELLIQAADVTGTPFSISLPPTDDLASLPNEMQAETKENDQVA